MRALTVCCAFVLPLLVACVVEQDDHSHNNNPPNSGQPLTVVIDTNQTMTAQGGQGVGVFVQYQAGGHWHVWWTCDTALSGLSCDFVVNMSGSGIANAAPSQFEANDVLDTSTPNQLIADTRTTTGTDAVDFDATAGANVTIDVTVSGLRDPQFFFFIEDGKVDGDYQGPLTDPLIFEPSTP